MINKSKNGSTLVVVIILTAVLLTIVASVLRHSLTERRLNKRSEQWLEARNTVEAIVEYGFAQLRNDFEKYTNISSDLLDPTKSNALKLPPRQNFSSNVDMSSIELTGGTIPSSFTQLFIDPDDPNNDFDPLRGKIVGSKEITLFGKATVNDPSGGSPITTYATQTLQVRDASLFSHAIFYNLDLEISPGPKMDIYGPVHTNGDLYVQGIRGVDFHAQVTTSGHMYYGWGSTNRKAQGSGGESLQRGHVQFTDRFGDLQTIKVDDSTFMDSTMGTGELSDKWRSYASNRWHGNLMTSDHGIEDHKPVAFDDYEPDDPDTVAYDPVNTGKAIIEPSLPLSHADYKPEIEKQKMSAKAGLRLVWDASTTSLKAYKQDGAFISDLSNLEGYSSDKLWAIRPDAMYDERRRETIDILDINVGKLKQLIESPGSDPKDRIDPSFNPVTDWNGVVYVETTSSVSDPRLHYSGVRLWGGSTNSSKTGQGIPSRGLEKGFSFATNNALYLRGDFNADGVRHNAASANHSAVVPEADEVPVAVFGDSVTVLSNNWDDAYSLSQHAAGKWSQPQADHSEIAAAIVTGLLPSDADGNNASSGGVHNFPRFLEKWSGRDLYIRGSLVALYESEVDDSPWRISYYSPPGRKWGFSNLFKNGTYPPGTPFLRTYRRINYSELSASEYAAEKSVLPW